MPLWPTEAEWFKYFLLPADFLVKILSLRKTFMEVKAPFAGHPAASSAWPPAETPSPLGGLESHCNKERQWYFVKNHSRNESRKRIKIRNDLLNPHRKKKLSCCCNDTSPHLIYSVCVWTLQSAWLVVELFVTLAASQLKTPRPCCL